VQCSARTLPLRARNGTNALLCLMPLFGKDISCPPRGDIR
jgi:hypothetical protein